MWNKIGLHAKHERLTHHHAFAMALVGTTNILRDTNPDLRHLSGGVIDVEVEIAIVVTRLVRLVDYADRSPRDRPRENLLDTRSNAIGGAKPRIMGNDPIHVVTRRNGKAIKRIAGRR